MVLTSSEFMDYFEESFKQLTHSGETISNKEFESCHFKECDFSETVFRGCRFMECSFENCNFGLADIEGCRFRNVTFLECSLVGIGWYKASAIIDFKLDNCVVNYCSFVNLNLKKALIKECVCREADFYGCNLSKAKLTGTNFENSRFGNTDLSGADFSDAFNYNIDPEFNTIKKAIFSLPEANSLLRNLDIILKE